jgi:hypothetical protein
MQTQGAVGWGPPRRSDVGAKLLAGVKAFFKADPTPFEEPPERGDARRNAPLANALVDFLQREIRLIGDQRKQPVGMVHQRRTSVTAHRTGLNPPEAAELSV